ncbi:hypothetical protein [Actinotalea sp. K2]|uniref:hypothetical protein n=1 Tax=Actinotalea sp. K2 TaxID=2939438 RepID=UPI002017B749|nr:hypothetical protein [Actinotalea sp. K2]MCL3863153.1 hypothetical protein [Actinotalea sp. K2]
MPVGPDPRFGRSVRLWMRAYPRRWRAARGAELEGLLVDLAAPGSRRLDARAVVDLVRGGWATRWREHPPLGRWLLYRCLDRRLPERYRPWAADDIDGFWYVLRVNLAGLSLVLPFLVTLELVGGEPLLPPVSFLWVLLATNLLSMAVWPEGRRRQARVRQLAPRLGEPLVEGSLVPAAVPGSRASARSVLPWAVGLLTVVAATSVVSAFVAPKVLHVVLDPDHPGAWQNVVGPIGGYRGVGVVVLVCALLLGLLGGVLTGRRLDRLVDRCPEQPHRYLRRISTQGVVVTAVWSGAALALGWFEVTGRLVLGAGIALGALSLVLLPGAWIALRFCQGPRAADLADRDVWHIAMRGTAPGVARPVATLAPLAGPVPDGAVQGLRLHDDPPWPATG